MTSAPLRTSVEVLVTPVQSNTVSSSLSAAGPESATVIVFAFAPDPKAIR
jgi:hypothetical protein